LDSAIWDSANWESAIWDATVTDVRKFRCQIAQVSLYMYFIFQLFQASESVIEVTQISLTDTQERPGAKKRRLESGWTTVRDIITSVGKTVQTTPWYATTQTLNFIHSIHTHKT
jgi:hypothetical protein